MQRSCAASIGMEPSASQGSTQDSPNVSPTPLYDTEASRGKKDLAWYVKMTYDMSPLALKPLILRHDSLARRKEGVSSRGW